MKIAEPKCPECGKHIFSFRIILDEQNLLNYQQKEIEEAKGDISDEKLETLLEQNLHMKRSANPFALAFCVNCGHIVGFAGRGYS